MTSEKKLKITDMYTLQKLHGPNYNMSSSEHDDNFADFVMFQ